MFNKELMIRGKKEKVETKAEREKVQVQNNDRNWREQFFFTSV